MAKIKLNVVEFDVSYRPVIFDDNYYSNRKKTVRFVFDIHMEYVYRNNTYTIAKNNCSVILNENGHK